MTCHRFLFLLRRKTLKRSVTRERSEKESGDQSPHSKGRANNAIASRFMFEGSFLRRLLCPDRCLCMFTWLDECHLNKSFFIPSPSASHSTALYGVTDLDRGTLPVPGSSRFLPVPSVSPRLGVSARGKRRARDTGDRLRHYVRWSGSEPTDVRRTQDLPHHQDTGTTKLLWTLVCHPGSLG